MLIKYLNYMNNKNKIITKRFSKNDYKDMAKLSGKWERSHINTPTPHNKNAKLISGDKVQVTDEDIENDLAWIYEKMDNAGIL
jgi:hypothetical protein